MLTGLAFTAGFLALLVLALRRHPIFGLYAYLVAFYVHPPSRWWSQGLPDLRWALLAGVVALAAVFIHRQKLRPHGPWFSSAPAAIYISYCLWMWIQNAWALDFDTHFAATVQYTKYLIAFYLVYRILDTRERLRDFLLVHLAGCAYLGLLAKMSNNFVGGRLNGVGGPGIDDANTLGMFLATGVVAGAGLLLGQNGWRRYVSFAGVALAMNGLVLAASRGAFLGLVGGGAVLGLLHPRQLRARFALLALVAMVGFVAVADQRFIDRMFSLEAVLEQSEEMDGSAASRFAIKSAQWQMFLDYPFGAGHKGTAVLSPLYLGDEYLTTSQVGSELVRARSSHNTFMTTLAEQGIVGGGLFIAFLIWLLIAIVRIFRDARSTTDPGWVSVLGALAGGSAVVLAAGIGTDYLMAEVQFWFAAALAAGLRMAYLPVAQAAPASTAMAPASGQQAGPGPASLPLRDASGGRRAGERRRPADQAPISRVPRPERRP